MLALPYRPEDLIAFTALWQYHGQAELSIAAGAPLTMPECALAFALQRRWIEFVPIEGYQFQFAKLTPLGERELKQFIAWATTNFWPMAFQGESLRNRRRSAVRKQSGPQSGLDGAQTGQVVADGEEIREAGEPEAPEDGDGDGPAVAGFLG